MSVSLSFSKQKNINIINFSGRFTGKESADVIKEIESHFNEEQKDIKAIVDLSNLDYIGSQGASALILLFDKYRTKIVSPPSVVRNTLTLLKIDSILEMYESLEETIDSFND